MFPEPAVTMGTSLAAVGARRSGAGAHPDVASGSRREILALLDRATTPLSVEEIAAHAGLHPSTARSHLDLLLADGRIERHRGVPSGKGRPPWLYAAAGSDEVSRLRTLLEDHLVVAEDRELLGQVAQVWAAATAEIHPVDTPADAVALAEHALTDLGFDAHTTETGDALVLRRCPYAALAADMPQVCEIHAALLSQVLTTADTGVTLAELDVWPQPDTCVARLRRPDRRPLRTVRGSPRAVAEEAD
jgi:predicted ArsR family transcriptional regulator